MSLLCNCLQCSQLQTVDEVTGRSVSGQYVSRGVHERHQEKFGQTKSSSSRQGNHRSGLGHAQNGIRKVPIISAEEVVGPIVSGVPSASQTSSPTGQAILDTIGAHLQKFHQSVEKFSYHTPPIVFVTDPVPQSDEPGELHYASSKDFLEHLHSINKILEALDAIDSLGLPKVRQFRKSVVQEVQGHLQALDSLKRDAWREFKTRQLQMQPELQPNHQGNVDDNAQPILDTIRDHMAKFRDTVAEFSNNVPPIVFVSDNPHLHSIEPPELHRTSSNLLLSHIHYVDSTLEALDAIESRGLTGVRKSRKLAIREIHDHLEYIEVLKKDAWREHKTKHVQTLLAENPGIEVVDCSPYFELNSRNNLPGAFLVSILTAVILHLIPGLAQNHTNFLLDALRIIITSACVVYVKHCFPGVHIAPPDPISTINGNQEWFIDIQSAAKRLHLHPDLIRFACCKKCFSCYGKKDGYYPKFCDFRETLLSPKCGQPLVTIGSSGGSSPIYTFAYQPIKSFIARLLSRPGIGNQMEAVTSSWNTKPFRMYDIFGASALRTFMGPDQKTPFLTRTEGEVRLVFSLFIDWFNPHGNKQAGKKRSIGAIYMVCLNLPIHLRYRVENVYIAGLIPGEPSTHHINHILRPFVADLKTLWISGLRLSQTAMHATGCLVRVAVLPFVADAPAMRKAGGYASVTAKWFCNFCKLTHLELDNFNINLWPLADKDAHVAAATSWKNAASEADRQSLFDRFQVRWSEFLELPYWDPIKFFIVDPMHTFFLNAVQQHVRDFLGINEEERQGRKGVQPHSPEEQLAHIRTSVSALKAGNLRALTSLRKTYLEHLASTNNVPLSAEDQKTTANLAKALLAWHSKLPAHYLVLVPAAHSGPAVDIRKAIDPTILLDEKTLAVIREDMTRTTMPTWVNRAPQTFGSAAHGKLSSDHWRTVFTINLVITLVRLWGSSAATPRQRELTDNFMALVTAIVYATGRTITEEQIQIVESNLLMYYQTLKKLKPAFKIHPSHHMTLHIPECLRLYGPVHGWWAYPYERYNGIIQRFNTNNKFAQMPVTFIETFCQIANLKAFLETGAGFEARPMLQQLKSLFDKHYKTEFRGSLLSDLLFAESAQETTTPIGQDWNDNIKETPLDALLYGLLAKRLNQNSPSVTFSTTFSDQRPRHIHLNPYVQDYSLVHAKGVTFSVAKKSLGNSCIIFCPAVDVPSRAGQIQRILGHTRRQPDGTMIRDFFFVVKEFEPLTPTEEPHDPYRRYPLVDVKLYRDELSTGLFLIKADDIVSHFASCPFTMEGSTGKYLVVLSLDRNMIVSHLPRLNRHAQNI